RTLSLKGDHFGFFFHDTDPLLFLKNHNDIIIQKTNKKTTGIFVVIRQKNCYTVKGYILYGGYDFYGLRTLSLS
ncbi:MAG: hypothetical protein ACI3W6_08020, partial [Clostridia bacterium]